jgi:hypothetical protein
MTFEGSLENLDQGEESDTGSIDAGAQLSFKYSSSTDGILYLVNGLSLFVDENGDWKVDSQAFERLLRTRNRSEGFWGPQDWFDSNGDPPYNPDEQMKWRTKVTHEVYVHACSKNETRVCTLAIIFVFFAAGLCSSDPSKPACSRFFSSSSLSEL